MGSGRSELARAIFGLDELERGTLAIDGAALAGTTAERIAAGLAFVTENRREEGLMMEASVADNLTLVAVRDFGRRPLRFSTARPTPGPPSAPKPISASGPPTSPRSR